MLAGLIFCLAITPLHSTRAEEKAPELPKIRAKNYDATFERKSKSTRVYLFNEQESASAKEGKIILIREKEKEKEIPLMAFRILKLYPEKKQFAARKIKHYGKFRNLKTGETVHAIEKISDLTAPPLTNDDKLELKELEDAAMPPPAAPDTPTPNEPSTNDVLDQMLENPAPPAEPLPEPPPPETSSQATPSESSPSENPSDSEIDQMLAEGEKKSAEAETAPLPTEESPPPVESAEVATPSPPQEDFDQDLDEKKPNENEGDQNKKGIFAANESENEGFIVDEDEEIGEKGITVEQPLTLDPYKHWLSFSFGSLKNLGSEGQTIYYTGAGLKYGMNIAKTIFFRNFGIQDSLTLEGGAFLYKVLSYNVDTPQDTYTVVPLSIIGRYNIALGETFGIFGYAGFVKNLVIGASFSDPNDQNFINNQIRLASLFPTFGGGLLFHLGPNWDTRVDMGLDLLGVGLALRF